MTIFPSVYMTLVFDILNIYFAFLTFKEMLLFLTFQKKKQIWELRHLVPQCRCPRKPLFWPEKSAVRLDDLPTTQKPDQPGDFRKRGLWEDGAWWQQSGSLLPFPLDGHLSFLRRELCSPWCLEGLLPWPQRVGYLPVSNALLLLFSAHCSVSWGKQPCPVRPVPLYSSGFSAIGSHTTTLKAWLCQHSLPSSLFCLPSSVHMCENCMGLYTFASQRSLEHRDLGWNDGNLVASDFFFSREKVNISDLVLWASYSC